MNGDTVTAAQDPAGSHHTATAVGQELARRGSDAGQFIRSASGSHASTHDGPARLSPADAAESAKQSQRAPVYEAPSVGPRDLATLPGPFTPRQLARIDEALTLATQETGLLFSLYVGGLAEPTRAAAEHMTARIPAAEGVGVVLLAVSPGQRVLHIVTARGATKRLTNRVCALAALGMRAAFAGGDLTAGIVNGLRMLADAAGGD